MGNLVSVIYNPVYSCLRSPLNKTKRREVVCVREGEEKRGRESDGATETNEEERRRPLEVEAGSAF